MPLSRELQALVKTMNSAKAKDGRGGYGAGTIVLASDIVIEPSISTGSLALDAALGGGIPTNQWTEVIAPYSSGKTTLANKLIAYNQALDENFLTLWIASEYYDLKKARIDGVDTDRVLVVNERVAEHAMQMMLEFQESKEVDLIVLDSLAQLSPKSEDDAEMEDWQVGLHARLTNKFFRKQGTAGKRAMTGGERPCTGIVINQWRKKIGVQHGDDRTSIGGEGKDYAFAVRIDLRRDEWIEVGPKSSKVRVGQTIFARIIKNKTAAPQRVARWDYYFSDATGPDGRFHPAGSYDSFKEIVGLGVVYGVVKQSGAWFSYDDLKTQGLPAFLLALPSDIPLAEKLEAEVLATAIAGAPMVEIEEVEASDLTQAPKPEVVVKKSRLPQATTPEAPSASETVDAAVPALLDQFEAQGKRPAARRPAKAS